MTNLDIRKRLDPLLKKLAQEKSLDVAEEVVGSVLELLNLKSESRYLLNIPRIDAELSRFELAPNFARQAAAFEIPVNQKEIFDPKLFWIKKTTKTNLSWVIGVDPNYEDSEANDYKSIGIDFVVPTACDSVIILLSNKYKIRSLELRGHLTHTQFEILSNWKAIKIEVSEDLAQLKKEIHSKLWESFNFEPINRKFYLELVEHFSLLVHHLEKLFDRKSSVMFTTRLIGRILFIWFLRKKALINQNIGYFDVGSPSNQDDYYKKKLEVLFFEVLNKEISIRQAPDKETSYLNGGLFDVNETDFYNDKNLSFPDGFFNNLFETLNKYNFTVDESSPEFQQVAIDPEMLGRIFESLLAEQIDEETGSSQKKVTGAFYTPREIVNYMCEQSIIEFIKSKVPDNPDRDRRIEELVRLPETVFRDQDQNKRRDWKPYSKKILKILIGGDGESPISILDPAVGSGAFPMGMLHLIVKICSRLDSKFENNISNLKRRILSKSLYGVDIQQSAIEICRLRAWLSIIVDVSEGDIVEPLPNLDFKFICANTPIALCDDNQHSLFEDVNLKEKLIELRDQYFQVSSCTKKLKLQHEYLKLTTNDGLFDSKRTRQLKNYKPFDISSSCSFYDPELHHGIHEFDLVIGNPPYYQLREIDKTTQDEYKKSKYHQYARGGRLNIFQYFVPFSIMVAKNSGIVCLITQNSILGEDTAISNRKYIFANTQVIQFISFPERDNHKKRVFESVKMSVAISLLQKIKSIEDKEFTVTVWKERQMLNSVEHKTTESDIKAIFPKKLAIPISSNHGFEILKAVKNLDNVYYLKSSAGEIDMTKFSEKFSNDKSGYRVVTGAQIHKYLVNDKPQQGRIYYLDESDIPTGGKFSYKSYPRLAFQRITGVDSPIRLIATIVPENTLLANSCNFVFEEDPIKLRYELGLLNSNLFNQIYKITSTNTNVTTSEINSIPIPLLSKDLMTKIAGLVDQILGKKFKGVSTRELESQIDVIIYRLYKLSAEDIQYLDPSQHVIESNLY